MLDELFEPYASELEAFGEYWCGPEKYVEWVKHLIAMYDPQEGGARVEVYCEAAPARFYTIKVFARKDYEGKQHPAYTLSTGSSQHQLAADIARAISEGMLVMRLEDTADA